MMVNTSEDGTKSGDAIMLCQGTGYIQTKTNLKYFWQLCGALYVQSHGGLNSVARYTPSIYPYGNTCKSTMQGGVH